MSETKTIERSINNILKGDALNNALDFVDFLRANKISLKMYNYEEENENYWEVIHKNEQIGAIGFFVLENEPGPWTFWFNSYDFNNKTTADDELKKSVWEHTNDCWNFLSKGKECGCGNQPGLRMIIFDKEFENRCFHSPLKFTNPDMKTLDNIKKLVLMFI